VTFCPRGKFLTLGGKEGKRDSSKKKRRNTGAITKRVAAPPTQSKGKKNRGEPKQVLVHEMRGTIEEGGGFGIK